jgi:hypothetical protein
VQRGAKTSDGHIIEAVTLPWFDIVGALLKDPELAFALPWGRLEEIVAGAYKRAGFEEVTLTPRSGDAGRDVIATKYGLGTIRVIESVKRYGRGKLVNHDDVRALLGVLGKLCTGSCMNQLTDAIDNQTHQEGLRTRKQGSVLGVLTRAVGLLGPHERHLACSGINFRRNRYKFASAKAVNNRAVFFARPR